MALTQSLRERYCAPPDFRFLLEQAGFVDVEVRGDHTEDPQCDRHHVAVFGATKA